MCVCVPHSSNAIPLTMATVIPTYPTPPPPAKKKTLKRNFPFRRGPPHMFCPRDQEKEKTKTKKTQAHIALKANSGQPLLPAKALHAVSNTEAGGQHPCPPQILGQLSLRLYGSLPATFSITQRAVGMESIHPLLPLRWPPGSGILISLAKILEPISGKAGGQAGARQGPGTRSPCFKPHAHCRSLASRD